MLFLKEQNTIEFSPSTNRKFPSNITLQSITNQYLMFYCISVESIEAADQTKPAGLLQDHSTHRKLLINQLSIGHINLITSFRLILPLQCCVTHLMRFLPEWVVCHLWNLWCLFTNSFFPFFLILFWKRACWVLQNRHHECCCEFSSTVHCLPEDNPTHRSAPFPGGHGPPQLPQDQNKEIPPNGLSDARLGGTPFTLYVPYAFFCLFYF